MLGFVGKPFSGIHKTRLDKIIKPSMWLQACKYAEMISVAWMCECRRAPVTVWRVRTCVRERARVALSYPSRFITLMICIL